MRVTMEKSSRKWIYLTRSLIFAYILTGILLLGVALLIFKAGITESVAAICMVIVYVVATLFAGFSLAKKIEKQQFLWGLLVGFLYFVVLLIISLAFNRELDGINSNFITTLALCTAGGMLGGMLG